MIKKRLTFGCFSDRVEEDYQRPICEGINDFCKRKDINFINYAGRPIDIPENHESLCNILFNFVDSERIDGLIVLSGSLCQFSNQEKLENIIEKYNHIPIVSISMVIENIPSILVDNQKGMYDAVEHLIKMHKVQKIAFIKGPEGHPEAEARFLGYKKALIDYNISLNPDLVVAGNFLESAGYEAVQKLINKKNISFDALIAANDDMAIGASMALENLNISVPNDIAIVGFDDLLKSRLVNPPLTTVRQPLYNIGKKAAEVLFKIINGKNVEKIITLPTEFVIRRSCGCFSKTVDKSTVLNMNFSKNKNIDPLSLENKLQLLHKSFRINKKSIEFETLERLNHHFLKNLEEGTSQSFLIEFDKVLKKSSLKDHDLDYWHDFISEMRRIYVPYFSSQKKIHISAENILHKSRILIGQTEKRIQTFRNYLEDRMNLNFLRCIESFHLAHRIQKLFQIITHEIKYLGIKSCYLCLYEDPINSCSKSKVIFSFDEGEIIWLNTCKEAFSTSLLIPEGIIPKKRRFEWVVESLRSQDGKQYGYIILEPQEGEIIKYGRISFHISAALQESYLFEDREELLKELEQINENLEEFNHIVSHDLKTPLTTILGYLSLLIDRHESELSLKSKKLVDNAINSAKRMNNLITDLLYYSCITQNKKLEEKIDCNELISEILVNLKLLIEKEKAKIILDKLPIIIGQKLQIKQLFQNLIENSIKFQGKNNPIIQIQVKKYNDKWLFSIKDNGIGIDHVNIDKIFKIFERLHHEKEYPGTGIGLSICKKVVENHGGSIWVESTLNIGSTFNFTLPYYKTS